VTNQSSEKKFFDTHTTGYGFLKRIREVIPNGKKRDAFLACTVAALSGPAATPFYRYYDVRVSGIRAQELVRGYAQDVEAGRPVLVDFRIGDVYSFVFQRTKGDHAGKPDAMLKGRLLKASVLELAILQQISHHKLVTRALGYVNRIIHSSADASLRRCFISMLNGPTDEPESRFVDVDVTDPDLVTLLDQYAADVLAKRKVFISFQLDDMQANFFTRTKGDKAGEHVPVLKSTLSHIGLVKVDGEERYRSTSKVPVTDASNADADAPSDLERSLEASADVPIATPSEIAAATSNDASVLENEEVVADQSLAKSGARTEESSKAVAEAAV